MAAIPSSMSPSGSASGIWERSIAVDQAEAAPGLRFRLTRIESRFGLVPAVTGDVVRSEFLVKSTAAAPR